MNLRSGLVSKASNVFASPLQLIINCFDHKATFTQLRILRVEVIWCLHSDHHEVLWEAAYGPHHAALITRPSSIFHSCMDFTSSFSTILLPPVHKLPPLRLILVLDFLTHRPQPDNVSSSRLNNLYPEGVGMFAHSSTHRFFFFYSFRHIFPIYLVIVLNLCIVLFLLLRGLTGKRLQNLALSMQHVIEWKNLWKPWCVDHEGRALHRLLGRTEL